MTHTFTRSLSAMATISAALALGSTPALAQDAAPTIDLPPPAASTPSASTPAASAPVVTPSAAPTIVLPEPGSASTAVEAPAPVAASSPAPTATREQPRAAATTRSTAREAAPRAVERAVTSEPRSQVAPAAPAEAAPGVRTADARGDVTQPRPAASPAAVQAPTRANDANQGIPGEAIVGLLGLLGIGAVGFAAARSRRRRVDEDEMVYAAAPRDAEQVREEIAERPALSPSPGADVNYGFTRARPEVSGTRVVERRPIAMMPASAPTAERQRDRVAMPMSAPTTADERSLMLDRMVEAEPDEANPFVSRKARRKRARLLLQKREHELQNSGEFDWRTYRPSTATTSASPDPVTV